MALRPTTYPKEHIESVEEGAPCFRGFATAVTYDDDVEDVIVIARTRRKLDAAVKQFGPDINVDPKSVYRVVMMRDDDATMVGEDGEL